MVTRQKHLDFIFSALADPTRRNILKHVAETGLTVGEITRLCGMSQPAVSKHLKVLEKASLIVKRRSGRGYLIKLSPAPIKVAAWYLRQISSGSRPNPLDALLK